MRKRDELPGGGLSGLTPEMFGALDSLGRWMKEKTESPSGDRLRPKAGSSRLSFGGHIGGRVNISAQRHSQGEGGYSERRVVGHLLPALY